MFQRYGKRIMWIGLALLIIFVVAAVYSLFLKPSYGSSQNLSIPVLLLGLALGALFMYLIRRVRNAERENSNKISESSHSVVESIKKVFKIVLAEGQISEVYNYKDSKKLLAFIPAYKSALVIVKAKVLIGFDIEKCKWEIDAENKVVKLLSIPDPELLSIETNYNYYSLDDEIFYKFGNEDFKRIQENAKIQVEKAAMESVLPSIAKEQLRTLLTEVINSKDWHIEDKQQLLLTR